jgi:transposase
MPSTPIIHPDAPLPDDPELLKHIIRVVVGLLHKSEHNAESLQHQLEKLLRRLYGPKRERQRPDQPDLFSQIAGILGEDEPPPPGAPAKPARTASKPRQPHGRRKMPDNLPRVRVEHDLPEAEKTCPCCRKPLIKIGEEVSEQLEYKPATLIVLQHVRFKYLTCNACPAPGQESTTTHPAGDSTTQDAPVVVINMADGDNNTETVVAAEIEAAAAAETIVADAAETIVADVAETPTAATETVVAAATDPDVATANVPIVIIPRFAPLPIPLPRIITASMPPQPIDKGLPGPGLLAYIATSKYLHHLPLYRLELIFNQHHGVWICRSTMCDWVGAMAELLTPLYDLMLKKVLLSKVVQCDETRLPVLLPNWDKAAPGRLWAYRGDRDHRYTIYDYRPDKSRAGPEAILGAFRGFLQADAANVFDGLYLLGLIIEAGCWAHCRRNFHDALTTDPVRAAQAVARIAEFYKIEAAAAKLIAERTLVGEAADALRLQMRREYTLPKLTAFKEWLESEQKNPLPKSPMGQAISYALNHWTALCRFTDHGFLEIDNNAIERAMKPVAVGRKNYLFAGSPEGGKRAAVMYTFTHTCRELGIDAFVYLCDVFTRLPSASPDQLEDFLPDRWAASQRRSATT